jgi:chromosome segregation protein
LSALPWRRARPNGSSDLAHCRTGLGEAQQIQNRLAAEALGRSHRLTAIAGEIADWQRRQQNGHTHIEQLTERRARTAEELAALESMPGEISTRRNRLLGQVSDAEANRQTAADALTEAENSLKQLDDALRVSERQLADMREEKGRCEGAVAQAEQGLATLVAQIDEKLDCTPEDTLDVAEHKPGADLPPFEDTERKLDRLLRERENMGPVNLRAEQEAAELQEQIETYTTEREDLLSAIEKFRRAIGELNREGKQRLLASFKTVNGHFQELFTRLFGGGSAHLELTDMDDPLNAGIEIMASPPGKKLQHLSLLSGGEQALTALSLLFAVFLTNPAPICILDEVDAPLDDSNVDRFCTLVEEIAERTKTRFLIVTHHRMTMARVDRLYGVTMGERGVSQLVSVDLEEAVELRATA